VTHPRLTTLVALSISLFSLAPSVAQATPSAGLPPAAPFSRGVNLSQWFETSSPRAIRFSRYTDRDFKELREMGADVVRLPIYLHAMTLGKPDYTLDPLFLELLDQAVDMAERNDMHIILDNHSFDMLVPTDPKIERILLKVWPQMAAHFRDRSDLVVYEILNEPHGIDPALWAKIQGKAIDAIRKVDTKHAIIVGGANFNCIPELVKLPKYADKNLIYTYHFYDPMVFTHQGAAFTGPSMRDLVGVPWPPESGKIPPVPAKLRGTWIDDNLRGYREAGTAARLFASLDAAQRFARERGVPLYCGEFGAMRAMAPAKDRAEWYRAVRTHLETGGVAWTSWDYYGAFGMFTHDNPADFERDLDPDIAAALGFKVPTLKVGPRAPEIAGFDVFTDAVGYGLVQGGWPRPNTVDYFAAPGAAVGKRYVRWTDIRRYDNITFDFRGVRDLSTLASKGYVLEFMAKAIGKDATFQVRFMNPESPNSIPWRMASVVDPSALPSDGAWHKVRIPLSSMANSGSWIDSSQKWFDPSEGSFAWDRVQSLQFVAEHTALAGVEICLDEIRLTEF
jgi:endoglucanase